MSSKYYLFIFFMLLIGCSNLPNTNCTSGTVEYCFPNNLQPIADPDNIFRSALPLELAKLDKDILKNKNIKIDNLHIDNELSQLWNAVLNDIEKYLLKINAVKESYNMPLFKVSVFDAKNYTIEFLENNFIEMTSGAASYVPKNGLKKFQKELNSDKTKNFLKKSAYTFIDSFYISKIFDDFYINNKKKVYIIPDTEISPFGIVAGDIFIPESFIKKHSKDEIYVALVHEAFHFFDGNKSSISKNFSQSIDDMDSNSHKKSKQKFFSKIGKCISFSTEFNIDNDVIFYLNSKKSLIYRNLLDSLLNEDEKLRIVLIDILIKYFENNDKNDFITHNKQLYMTDGEKEFINNYQNILYTNKKTIDELNNKISCFETL